MNTVLVPIIAMMLSATDPGRFNYPAPHKSDVVDDHFGHKIADPYRRLEDPNSPETQAWVAAENRITFDYLATIPERAKIHERLTELWNYERFSPPSNGAASACSRLAPLPTRPPGSRPRWARPTCFAACSS